VVERRKFLQTYREITAQFGGVSLQGNLTQGRWIHQGRTYEDRHRKVVVDVEDSPENEAFFVKLKHALKERFRQLDIWIVSYEIRIT
jgi:hypothetical protein